MTGRCGVEVGGVQPEGRWNGDIPLVEVGALVGERDRVEDEIESRAMACCKQ